MFRAVRGTLRFEPHAVTGSEAHAGRRREVRIYPGDVQAGDDFWV